MSCEFLSPGNRPEPASVADCLSERLTWFVKVGDTVRRQAGPADGFQSGAYDHVEVESPYRDMQVESFNRTNGASRIELCPVARHPTTTTTVGSTRWPPGYFFLPLRDTVCL